MRAIQVAAAAAAVAISPLAVAQPGSSAPPVATVQARTDHDDPVRLPPDEVVRRALAQSPLVRGARANRDTASAQSNSLRGHLLPSVGFSDEVQHWDSAFVVPFPTGSKGVLDGFVPVTAREQNTNSLIVSAGQPLLGLLHLGADLAATRSLVGAADADVRAGEAGVKEGALSQLLALFEARELIQIARASVEQLDEQLQVARARAAAGVATRADVLRIETAAANARQQEIEATAREESARAALLVTIGEPPDASGVEFEAPVLPEPEPAPALPDALRAAVVRRPELESARVAHDAARKRLQARTFDLLPEVNAEAAYLHFSGNAFQPEDSAFVGIKVDMPVWDWGAKWYARSAAAAQADATAARETAVRDQVAVEVSSRLAAVRAAASAVAVARTAIISAEEAYRVTDALVKAGSATTTDLLDAQAALTTTRSNLARAGYSYALRRVNLARATGQL